jgi:hypothetical protein
VNATMTRLEQNQGVSRDLVARQHRLMFYLETADGALRKGNIEQARSSLNNAERELQVLEASVPR